MVKQEKALAKRARDLWARRDLPSLARTQREPGAARLPQVLYFVGLALNALNQRREAIECWRKARTLDPQNENALRALAYELMDQAPVEAAELFSTSLGRSGPMPMISRASVKSASSKTG